MFSLLSFWPFHTFFSLPSSCNPLVQTAWRVSRVSANQQNLLNLQSTIVQRLARYTLLTDARALLATIGKGVADFPAFRAEAIIPRGCAVPLSALISHIIAQLSHSLPRANNSYLRRTLTTFGTLQHQKTQGLGPSISDRRIRHRQALEIHSKFSSSSRRAPRPRTIALGRQEVDSIHG